MLSIIIPCYNEEELIDGSYKELKIELYKLDKPYEIIFVNDGSTDSTLHKLRGIHKKNRKVRVITYKKNMGVGYAYRKAFEICKGDIIITMDADMMMKPKDTLSKFLTAIKESDIVLASRFLKGRADYPLKRYILSRAYNALNRILFKLDSMDTQSGFMAFKKSILKHIRLDSNGFEVYIELITKAKKKSYSIIEIPLEFSHKIRKNRTKGPISYTSKILINTLRIWIKG